MLKLESDALAGRVCVLSVQVKDQFNTNFKVSVAKNHSLVNAFAQEGGDFVAADFKGPAHFEGYVEDNNDGTYKISFFPTRTGSYKAYVTINGTDVKNSPFAFGMLLF
jgi:predicted ATP-grasp superfamily ATP-dependent carboligase